MFKTIQAHPNYAVSNDGYVINKRNGHQLNIRVKKGYCFVGISVSHKIKKWVSLHRLVAIAFIPVIEGKDFVNHKDGNKLNNHYSNLEWNTRLENNRHAIRMGLSNPTMNRVRPVYQYDLEGNFIREWQSGRFAARELGIDETIISKTALGQEGRKQAGGFIWKFKDQVTPPLSQKV